MCNLIASALVVLSAFPWIGRAIVKSLSELFKGIQNIGRWVKETTDTIANDVVVEMVDEGKLAPSNGKSVYWAVRVLSFLVILYGLITAVSILSMIGGL